MDNRQALLDERKNVIFNLETAEKTVFFSDLYPGSHEPTQEGFFAAQANAREKEDLKQNLEKINKELGIPADSREQITQ